jgi:hypothetical protein
MSTPTTFAPFRAAGRAAQHVGAALGGGQSRRSVAAAEIQHLHARCDAEVGHEPLPALAHAVRDAREVAFFPERLVRIHGIPQRDDAITSSA